MHKLTWSRSAAADDARTRSRRRSSPLKVLMVASEAVPLVKTGGLGDVIGALPPDLRALGHDVRVVLPFYSAIDVRRFPCTPVVESLWVHLPAGSREMSAWSLVDPPGGVPTYLVKDDGFFCRHGIYDEDGRDYPDNPLRYGYFCKAVFWLMEGIGWFPDILHGHDWQSALIPTFLANDEFLAGHPAFSLMRTLLTIHNLAYQGVCSVDFLEKLGLDRRLLNPAEMEFFGRLNLLKGGLVYADALSTVSPRYAREIQTPEFGCGLEGVLRHRARRLHGILNGIDTEVWNPADDPHLPATYSADDLSGKAVCKAELQREFGLPVRADVPLVGLVSRIVEQKGLNLVAQAIYEMLDLGIQFVILGKGMAKYERHFSRLSHDHPTQISARIGYSEDLAHRIEAGCDVFLMPSRFEPCGLNQLYSMRYGTVPVVHRVGGLADSVIDASPEAVAYGEATGFVFDSYLAEEMMRALRRAVETWRERPEDWRRIVRAGMRRDFSWRRSAREYEKLMEIVMRTSPGKADRSAGPAAPSPRGTAVAR